MITFREFVERAELSESSGGERGRRRVSSRGPSSDKFERNKQRNVSSSNAALKKAGFKRSTKYMSGAKGRPTKWTETSTSSHHGTETATHANQSDYASRSATKRGATSTRVSKLKKIRTQLGGDRTSRPVHDVSVNKKRTYNDTPSSTMTKGRSFRKEVTKGVPDNLKKAGAKTGDIVTSSPTSGSRSRMYGRTHNARTDSRTGKTANRFREAFDILEANRHPIPSDQRQKWQQEREAGTGPVRKTFNGIEYQMRNKARAGQPKVWAVSPSSDRKASSEKRSEKEKETAITQDELRDTAKRDVTKSNPDERASAAYDAEQKRMSGITKRVTKTSKSSGVKQSKDHEQPLQRKAKNPENQERLDKVLPGHNSDNLKIKPLVKNSSKQNTPPKPGESGYTLTRASMMQKQLKRGDKLLDKVGREIASTQSGTPSRAARLLSRLRRPRPKDTGAAQRMASAYDRAVGRSFEN